LRDVARGLVLLRGGVRGLVIASTPSGIPVHRSSPAPAPSRNPVPASGAISRPRPVVHMPDCPAGRLSVQNGPAAGQCWPSDQLHEV